MEDLGKGNDLSKKIEELLLPLQNCSICPRECGVDRFKTTNGICRSGAGFYISSICRHRGEEPVISGEHGICNVFFSHCNLQCIYCQNYQISDNKTSLPELTLEEVTDQIVGLLSQGCSKLGFVSPSHFIPQMKAIIAAVRQTGYRPPVVFNTNGYDKVETIRELEEWVDIYLPDFKYLDARVSRWLSKAEDYPVVIKNSIKEMYRQKGSSLLFDENDELTSGLIIRHLVIPGLVKESIEVLEYIADEISTSVRISLMSQYYPENKVIGHPQLGRKLHPEEYHQVVEAMENLGFRNGWIQEMESSDNYRPDFEMDHPFER